MQIGHTFRTRSDTEVLLRGYAQWKDGVAQHLNGMYAAALWDAALQKLVLLRDRLGVKPLHYYSVDAWFSRPSPRLSFITHQSTHRFCPPGFVSYWI